MPAKKGKLPSNQGKKVESGNPNRPRRPIDLLFGSGARVDVLWCLMNDPWHTGLDTGEISRITGRSLKDVNRALDILLEVGLVAANSNPPATHISPANLIPSILKDRQALYRRTRYWLDPKNPWVPNLKTLLEMALGGIDLITDALANFPDITVAFIFGSIATSEQNQHSDIDLMLIGDFNEDEMLSVLSGLGKKIGREIQHVSYKPDEWYNAIKEKKHFIVSLMESPKIFIKGSVADLDRIAFGRDA